MPVTDRIRDYAQWIANATTDEELDKIRSTLTSHFRDKSLPPEKQMTVEEYRVIAGIGKARREELNP